MPLDRDFPLLDFEVKERVVPIPELGMDWTTVSQTESLDGDIIQRQFSEFEFNSEVELELGTGSPSSHPDSSSYSYHYKLKSEFYIHQYSGQSEWVSVENGEQIPSEVATLASYNDFNGWSHDTQLFNKTDYWTDDLRFVVVWRLYSKPGVGVSATDSIYTFNAAGTLTNTTTLTEPTYIEVMAGTTWGMRTEASNNFQFEMRDSSNQVVETWGKTGNCSVPAMLGVGQSPLPITIPISIVSSSVPRLLTKEKIRVVAPNSTQPRPVLTVTVVDPDTFIETIVTIPQVIEEVRLYFYGNYWINDLEFVNTFSQGFLEHPNGTSNAARLKPPGKSFLSDSFNKVQEDPEPNATRIGGIPGGSNAGGSSGSGSSGGSGGSGDGVGTPLSSSRILFTETDLTVANILVINLATGIKGAGVNIFDEDGNQIDPDAVTLINGVLGVKLTSHLPFSGTWTAFIGD